MTLKENERRGTWLFVEEEEKRTIKHKYVIVHVDYHTFLMNIFILYKYIFWSDFIRISLVFLVMNRSTRGFVLLAASRST